MPRTHLKYMSETTKLDSAISAINKKFGDNTIGRIGEMPSVETERVSSGSSYLVEGNFRGFNLYLN